MTNSCLARLRNENGAVLVHVTVAIVGLLAFAALVVDYGVMWSARRQAQNTADGAALAGAVSMAYDAPGDYDRARAEAKAIGDSNLIYGASPNITLGSGDSDDTTEDISFPACPPGSPGVPDTCVRVNVYRNEEAGRDPLPTFFARLFGRSEQGVKAMAIAQILTGNATDCMKPWAIADKWGEHVKCSSTYNNGTGKCNGTWEDSEDEGWTETSVFDRYTKDGPDTVPDPTIPPMPPDEYVAPTEDDPGTGFQPFDENGDPTSDYGRELYLKLGSQEKFITPGWFLALDLPGCEGGGGADCYRWNIKNCNPTTWAIGDELDVNSEQGNMVGPTEQAVEGGGGPDQEIPAIIERDPTAEWSDCATGSGDTCAPGIVNSCAASESHMCPSGVNGALQYEAFSPRIVPIPLFDVQDFYEGNPTGKTSVTITNIAGFYVDRYDSGAVVGRLVAYPGLTKGTSSVDETASFLRTVILVR